MRQSVGFLSVALVVAVSRVIEHPTYATENQSGLTQAQQQAIREVLLASAQLNPPIATGPERRFQFLEVPGTTILLVELSWYDQIERTRLADHRVWAWRPGNRARVVADEPEDLACVGGGWRAGSKVNARALNSILPDLPRDRLDYLTIRLRLWFHMPIETPFGEWPERFTELGDRKRTVALLGEKLTADLNANLAQQAAMKQRPLGRCIIVTGTVAGVLPHGFASCFEPLDGTEAALERKVSAKVEIFGNREAKQLVRIENCEMEQ